MITPAALKALAEGDTDNFLVASTSGGIEAQEKAGQLALVNSHNLPKEMDDKTKAALEGYGVVFGDDKDFLHKHSTSIIKNYDIIAVEDIAVRNIVRHPRLAPYITDAAWGGFLGYLEYKAKWYGREFVRVGRFYPSSKTCGDCGHIQRGLLLDNRSWTCSSCGVIHDRDLNAARNILREGLRELSERLSPSTIMEAV